MNKSDLDALQTNEEKEQLTLKICANKVQACDYDDLLKIITTLWDNWTGLSTARLKKIVKQIFESVKIDMKTYEDILRLLDGLIKWADDKKMLRLDLEW